MTTAEDVALERRIDALAAEVLEVRTNAVPRDVWNDRLKRFDDVHFLLQEQIDGLYEVVAPQRTSALPNGPALPLRHIFVFTDDVPRLTAFCRLFLGMDQADKADKESRWFSLGTVNLVVHEAVAGGGPLGLEAAGRVLFWFETTNELSAVRDTLIRGGCDDAHVTDVIEGGQRRLLYVIPPTGNGFAIFQARRRVR